MDSTKRLEADVKAILNQGGNPVARRADLAFLRGVSVEIVDVAIAAVGGTARVVDSETVAQERLANERRLRGTNASREANHDE